MKRFHLVIALAIATVVAVPSAAISAPPTDSVQGPQCGNIALDAVYRSLAVPTVVGVLDTEGAAACDRVTYTVYVYTPDGTTQIASLPLSTSQLGGEFQIPIAGGGDEVCVYAESTIGPHVIDRAPDEGCAAFGEPLILTTSAGATSFR